MLLFLGIPPAALAALPPYPNSVASNDLDFILEDDPGSCWSISEVGVGQTEMYDPRRDALIVDGAIRYDVTYPEQELWIAATITQPSKPSSRPSRPS